MVNTAFRGLVAFMLVTSLYSLVTRRVSRTVGTFTAQSLALGLYAVLTAFEEGEVDLFVLAALTIVIKGIVIPFALLRVLDRVQIRNEVEYLVNVPSSAVLGGLLTLAGFVFAESVFPDVERHFRAALGSGASSILLGLLVMIGRRKMIMKVVGLLFMENGVILAVLGLTRGMPLIVEFGVALDVAIAVQILAMYGLRLRGAASEVPERVR